MSSLPAGWYKDPADTSTQRYWDGDGWLGAAIPADAVPPDGPPAVEAEPPATPSATLPYPHSATPSAASSATSSGAPPATPAAPSGAPPAETTPQPYNAPQNQPQPGFGPPPNWHPGWGPQAPPGQSWQQPPPGWQSPPPPQGYQAPQGYPAPPPEGYPAPPPQGHQTPPPQGWQTPPQGWQGPPPGWQGPYPGWQQPPAQGWQPPPGAQPPHAYLYPIPEARPHGMALAGLGQRLMARIIDIVLVLVLNVAINGWFVYQWLQDFMPIYRDYMDQVMAGQEPTVMQPTAKMQTLSWAVVLIATLVWLAYEAPSIASRGQTLGKRLMRIKVVRLESTEPIGFGRAFARWARIGMWTLFWWCGLGLVLQFLDSISPLFDQRLRQAWHDKAAATVVIALPPPIPTAPGVPGSAPGPGTHGSAPTPGPSAPGSGVPGSGTSEPAPAPKDIPGGPQ
ncbi:RDD family protein [Actinoplanes sp. NPDC051851]|uniref:RDD family protein n=1 Tax=Actinoplanes sp. NPDC051851 TaxID=3154753 RepID=UPI00342B8DCC